MEKAFELSRQDENESKNTTTEKTLSGFIFDIQQFSLHDGHGIRTLVFMKGCPLRCEWCSNPESQTQSGELLFYEEKCIHCGECLVVCPIGRSTMEGWLTERKRCIACGECAKVCDAEARKFVGRIVTIPDVMKIVVKDSVYYRKSGGGVTVGGGEPTCQAEFVAGLLRKCQEEGINTALETCGYTSWESLKNVLRFTDLLLFDIKHMDSDVHRGRTGVKNEMILENARRAATNVREMIIRVPLIPGFNNSPNHLHMLGRFIKNELSSVKQVDILPYHSIGESKSAKLGRRYVLNGAGTLSKEEIAAAKEILHAYDLHVTIGG